MLHNCKQVAEQASDNLDNPLTGFAWFKLKVHLLMCKHCERYVNQMALSSETVKSLDGHREPDEKVRKNVEGQYRKLHCDEPQDKIN